MSSYRSYHLTQFGSIDGITLREHDLPPLKRTEILVRVHAATINRRDAMIVGQTYPLPPVADVIPLSDGAGEVAAIGEAVSRFQAGDRVVGSYWPRWRGGRLGLDLRDQLGCTLNGMLTEYAVLDEQWAARVPDHLEWAEAAALPCAAVTAWTSLTAAGGERLVPGQTVLTLGTGDVSLFAVQLAKAMGCRVISTTSAEAKADRLKALGADHVIDYRRDPEWWPIVRELTGGQGADLIVETAGYATIDQSVRAAGLYGQIVLLNAGPGPDSANCVEISSAAYSSTMASIRRVFVGSRADLEALLAAVDVHRIRPVLDREFEFDDARAAYAHYLDQDTFGKVVVRMRCE